ERQFVAAPRRFAEPERYVWRLALRVLDAYASALDPQNPVRRIAELEHVAGQTLDREILVDGADIERLRFEHHRVIGVLRNRAARRDGDQFAAAPAAQRTAHRVPIHAYRARTVAARIAFGEHAQHRVVLFAFERRIGRGAPD